MKPETDRREKVARASRILGKDEWAITWNPEEGYRFLFTTGFTDTETGDLTHAPESGR